MDYITLPPVTDPALIAKYGVIPQGISGDWQLGSFMFLPDGRYVDIRQWDPTTYLVPVQGVPDGYASSGFAQDPSTTMPNIISTSPAATAPVVQQGASPIQPTQPTAAQPVSQQVPVVTPNTGFNLSMPSFVTNAADSVGSSLGISSGIVEIGLLGIAALVLVKILKKV